MQVYLDPGAHAPTRAHPTDAGLDLYAMEDGVIPAGGAATFHTGVHVKLPPDKAGILLPKSGLMTKHDILTFGVIDEGYAGEIIVRAQNRSAEHYRVHRGDKITQMLVVPVCYEPVELVDALEQTSARGSSGFGSTGR